MKKKRNSDFDVHCGKSSNSMEDLEALCSAEAELLLTKICVGDDEILSVPFWTDEMITELICVGRFSKNDKGEVIYELDYSESTL